MRTRVTIKGQVTIPKRVRDCLGIAPGTAVKFEMTGNGDVVLRKADGGRPASRAEALRGTAMPGMSTHEVMAMLRGDPDE